MILNVKQYDFIWLEICFNIYIYIYIMFQSNIWTAGSASLKWPHIRCKPVPALRMTYSLWNQQLRKCKYNLPLFSPLLRLFSCASRYKGTTQRTAPTGPANALTRRALSFATAVYRDGDWQPHTALESTCEPKLAPSPLRINYELRIIAMGVDAFGPGAKCKYDCTC